MRAKNRNGIQGYITIINAYMYSICTVYVVVVYLDFEGNAPCEVNFILDLIVWITIYIS
jgi:hypothetical protein